MTKVSITSGSKNWSRENVSWMAGLLEGEGCFCLSEKRNANGSTYPVFCVSMNMTDEDVVNKLAQIAGVGYYSGPYTPSNPKHKPFWRWHVGKRLEVYALLVTLHPFMGVRRKEKIEAILTSYSRYGKSRWKHGTRQGYEYHLCKCASCRAANTARHQSYRKQRATRSIANG